MTAHYCEKHVAWSASDHCDQCGPVAPKKAAKAAPRKAAPKKAVAKPKDANVD